jgi:uncharacterized damage-inducible protein DinB
MDVTELVRYNLAVRQMYFTALEKLPWNEVVAPRGLSFDSARNVFLHLTLVEDRWISYTLQGRLAEWKDPNFENYQTPADLKTYMQTTHENTEKFLQTLQPSNLTHKVTIPWGNTPNTQITFETALTHMVMECMVHYGELSAMFWQLGLEAPYFAFWRYKTQQATPKKATVTCQNETSNPTRP